MDRPGLEHSLVELLGVDRVSADPAVLEEHGTDKWHFANAPDIVVFAESTGDVSKTLRFANEHGIPVTPRGAGVGYVGGCVPVKRGIALSLARMNAILDLAPDDGVAVVQPGVITGDLQDAARERGWYYPPDPASLRECSIGGNIATNAGGPRCLKYGVTRQYVLGLEVVLADGTVMRTGGRNHKNKTGFDLIGMFVGSEGLLGVVTEITLRLIPHPQTRSILTCTFETFAEAAGAVQATLDSGRLPSALEITDGFTLQAARNYLGAEALPTGNAHLIVEIDGRARSVALEIAGLREFLRSLGAKNLEEAADEKSVAGIWNLRREFSYSLRATGLTKLNEDVVVPRSKLVDLVEFAHALEKESGIPVACFGHAGDGNIHVNLMVKDYEDPEARAHADAALDKLFRWIIENGGAITGEHGIGVAKKRWFHDAISPGARQVHESLKAALDPRGILNPGKFAGGIAY